MNVLITGANGFVGRAVVDRFAREADVRIRCAVRRTLGAGTVAGRETIAVGDIGPETDWAAALKNVDVVVHLAGRVHHLHDDDSAAAEYRRGNTEGTLNLARAAAARATRRFVFVSTLKVNGDAGTFTESDEENPVGPYAVSKHAAEQGLRSVGETTGMAIRIVRPPMVYGPGVKGNFLRLVNLVAAGIPLPLGSVRNQRSLVAVDNLADFIFACARDQREGTEVYFVRDDNDVSTPLLIRTIAASMNKNARLFPFPPALLRLGARATGRAALAERLLGSLRVSIDKARTELGWKPVVAFDDAVARAVAGIMPQ